MKESWLESYLWKHLWHFDCVEGWFSEAALRLIVEAREKDGFFTLQTFEPHAAQTRNSSNTGKRGSKVTSKLRGPRGRIMIKLNAAGGGSSKAKEDASSKEEAKEEKVRVLLYDGSWKRKF